MSGKIFVGNTSNIATLPKNILVGNPNNIAKNVKAVYVGNSQNQAVKVWPNGGGGLPSEFQQIEYIMNSNNSSYIDTKYSPDSDSRIYMEINVYSFHSGSNASYLCGTEGSEVGKTVQFITYSLGARIYMGFGKTSFFDNINMSANINYVLEWNRSGGGDCYINNTLLFNSYDTFQSSGYPFCIFANNNASVIQTSTTTYKLYSFKVWHGTELQRDMIPCYNKNNLQQVGMYDIVNGVFYGDESGNIFYKGPDVNTNI